MTVEVTVRIEVTFDTADPRQEKAGDLAFRNLVVEDVRAAVENAVRVAEDNGFSHDLEDELSLHVARVTARAVPTPG